MKKMCILADCVSLLVLFAQEEELPLPEIPLPKAPQKINRKYPKYLMEIETPTPTPTTVGNK